MILNILQGLVGGLGGLALGYFIIGPWLERLERIRTFNLRWKYLEEQNRQAHPEDQLTDEQLALIKEEERKYWSIH